MVMAMLADQPAYFLVEMKIKPTNNIKVYLDGDQGITIEKCITFNRALYKKIEEAGLFPTHYPLPPKPSPPPAPSQTTAP